MVAACLAATMVLSGCTTDGVPQLPPTEASALVDTYEDALAELGVRLTDRGGLMDQAYEPDPEGTHLSLYVAPLEPLPDEAYIDGLVDVTAVFARDVFERWPGLVSFDVCQEVFAPPGSDPDVARTQVALTRDAAAAVDWDTASAGDVVDTAAAAQGSHVLLFDDDLRALLRERLSR